MREVEVTDENISLGEQVRAEALLKTFANELRTLLTHAIGTPFLPFLVKWGFLNSKDKALAKSYAGYMTAVSNAVATALVSHRASLEADRTNLPNEEASS